MDPDVERRLAAIEARLNALEIVGAGFSRPGPAGPAKAGPHTEAPKLPKRDLESLIGAHWLNRVGIAAVLVGAAYFLKYAFENNWVGPEVRVIIGVVSGIAILVWSELVLPPFSHSLKVLAVGILYLSIWAASEMYSLIGGGAAFAAMTIVTGSLVALALRHRSEFIAGLAITGGFLTPVLLSTGTNREVALFTYVGLLDVAALVLVVLYPWIRVLLVAFVSTLFLYIGWATSYYSAPQMNRTIGFLTLFLIIFGAVALVRKWQDLTATVVLLLAFANAFAYFIELTPMLRRPILGRYAIGLAALYLIARFVIHDAALSAAHLAIALGFVTVAIPLQLDGLGITIGWVGEAAALLALSQTVSPAVVFRRLGSFALALAVFRLLFLYQFHPQHLLWNLRALTYAMTIAVFAGIAIVTIRKGQTKIWRIAVVSGNALALIGLTEEVWDFFGRGVVRDFTWSALWMLYGAALMVAGFRRRVPFLRWLALALLAITVGKVFFFDLAVLERIYRILSFIGLGVLLLAISFAYQKKWRTV